MSDLIRLILAFLPIVLVLEVEVPTGARWELTPDHLIRDRDACYGEVFVRRIEFLGIQYVRI